MIDLLCASDVVVEKEKSATNFRAREIEQKIASLDELHKLITKNPQARLLLEESIKAIKSGELKLMVPMVPMVSKKLRKEEALDILNETVHFPDFVEFVFKSNYTINTSITKEEILSLFENHRDKCKENFEKIDLRKQLERRTLAISRILVPFVRWIFEDANRLDRIDTQRFNGLLEVLRNTFKDYVHEKIKDKADYKASEGAIKEMLLFGDVVCFYLSSNFQSFATGELSVHRLSKEEPFSVYYFLKEEFKKIELKVGRRFTVEQPISFLFLNGVGTIFESTGKSINIAQGFNVFPECFKLSEKENDDAIFKNDEFLKNDSYLTNLPESMSLSPRMLRFLMGKKTSCFFGVDYVFFGVLENYAIETKRILRALQDIAGHKKSHKIMFRDDGKPILKEHFEYELRKGDPKKEKDEDFAKYAGDFSFIKVRPKAFLKLAQKVDSNLPIFKLIEDSKPSFFLNPEYGAGINLGFVHANVKFRPKSTPKSD